MTPATRRRRVLAVLTAAVVAGLGLLAPAGAATVPTAAPAQHRACSAAPPGAFRCFAVWRSGAPQPQTSETASGRPTAGYRPEDIRRAYRLPVNRGAGSVIAIVDAYDNPRAEADLAVYRRAFGLPACTTATGCLRIVNQRGGSHRPAPDPGWGVEIALDLQAASAACPRCRLLLVEGDNASLGALGAATDTAARLGAAVVSNSYGTDEFNGMAAYQSHYAHRGVAVVASSGDYGFTAAQLPAVFPTTIAVGGTSLTRLAAGGWRERAWSGSGSGCSAYIRKPAWQHDRHCRMRTVADLSAVGDPATGLAVYDTYGLGSDNGWIVVGGTSLSAPLVAGMIGLAGNGPRLANAAYSYAHRAGLSDVIGGRNGFCGGDYLCTALRGYDAPTGWGSPRGLGAL